MFIISLFHYLCALFLCRTTQDGLDEKETETIFCIAEIMGVSKESVQAMMEIVAEEEALKKKRIAVCIPDHPCLAPEYKK